MRALNRLGSALAAVALTTATAAAFAGPASAATAHDSLAGAGHAVFVQTDNTAGNRVVAYHRSGDGTLTLAHSYSTDGLGGQLTGSVVDHLASQGSLTYDPWHGLLYAVNAARASSRPENALAGCGAPRARGAAPARAGHGLRHRSRTPHPPGPAKIDPAGGYEWTRCRQLTMSGGAL